MKRKPELEGVENWRTDIEIFKMIRDKQKEGDPLLTEFRLILGFQKEDDESEETNTIYVIRGQDSLLKKAQESEWFETHTQVILHTSNISVFDAIEKLRSTYLRIKNYMKKEPFWAYTKTSQRTPLFDEEGRIFELAIDFTSIEFEESLLDYGYDDYEVFFEVESSVERTHELDKHYPPIKFEINKKQTKKRSRFV
ncbi:hypothetical protein [Methanosphaera sp.]|uniref:hypothetical protein n=1 Tax=Methanosphaera sp. TaxID=2666342 RepID=UPI0025D4FE00|nr:hypothetical protein [Methanosphaera sp.]